MDDADRHLVAGLPAHEIVAVCWAQSASPARFPHSCSRRSPASSSTASTAAKCSSGRRRSPWCSRCARCAHALASHHHRRSPGPQRHAGHHQRIRHAWPPVVHGPDGRRPRRPLQRHRHQFVHGQCRAPHRPLARRIAHRRHQRRLVLPRRWRQLHRRDRFAADDARDAATASSATT